MKNKIKKILLLGMTAMFTAGAAGTAVISCPVWADEAEQNSETAEEPKAEDAAVEEEIADQTDDKTENTDLKTVEHPRMSVYSIRRFSIVKDGEEVFQIKQEPADYKMDFDYWEITNPYDETATVNTETCEGLGLDLETVKKDFEPLCTQVNEIVTAESFDDVEK